MDTPDLTRAQWHTSTYSGGNGSCIEVARNLPGIAAVRDSNDRQGPKLVLQRAQWHRFIKIGAWKPRPSGRGVHAAPPSRVSRLSETVQSD